MKDSPDSSTNPGTLPHKRPWQLLVVGEGGTLLTQQDIEDLTRILDLLPHVAGLDITTSAGSARVSRDVPGNYIQQADQILAGMFTRNPDVTGITFPAPHGRAAHTATPDDPHVLPHDRALTAIMDARQRGEITADEMIAQIRQADA